MTAADAGIEDVAVRARGLRKAFRAGLGRAPVVAVADATFDVRRGEIFALLGPNGAGKSTTLRILAGLVRPTAGSVQLLGVSPDAAAERGYIGYLADPPALYDHLTPDGLLALGGALAGLPAAESRRRTDELLERLGIAAARGRSLRRLSTGTRQRAALAMALLATPPVLLLDEPMSGLDPLAHAATRALLAGLRAAGTTVVVSTHVLADAEATCDRVAIMVGGHVRRLGAPHDLAGPLLGTAIVLAPGLAGLPALPAGATADAEARGATRIALPAGADAGAFVRAALDRGAALVSVTPARASLADVLAREVAAAEEAAA